MENGLFVLKLLYFLIKLIYLKRLYENVKLTLCFEEWNGPNYDDLYNKKSMIISYFMRKYAQRIEMKIYHLIEDYTMMDQDEDKDKKEDKQEMEEWFTTCYKSACDHIKNSYLNVVENKHKTIFTFFLNGVDADDVKHVLFEVQENVLSSNLRRAPTLW